MDLEHMEGENLKPDYLKVNPRGLLPTLELDDGTRIDETVAICRYIEESHPEPKAEPDGQQRGGEGDDRIVAAAYGI